ncbi:ADOP family duplicated permease [uncultured Paludibaculum sp.]|uniref:ADOP family duplicated permease n=1 Tax=uncultured Paludibaculum sp. TaxID=1765020 RepID=UPI002AAC10B6|nr:ADOP family duplicated permease [uncultured Paludibaculum sp.]
MTGHERTEWRSGEMVSSFLHDLRFAIRSLSRAKGLTATVVLTLALGIGANAAIFTLVRGVLLRPLVNRDEDRLIYIQQSAPGMGAAEVAFSVPEIQDLRAGVKSLSAFGEFSTIDFTMVGLGDPREVRAGVVDGSFFEVMGLRPVLGRLLDKHDDGPNAAGACVLTHRFWTTQTKSDPAVLGKTIRLGERSATVVGVLEPAIPYPAETEIIANVVTSPHHLSATMVTGRVHRMTELFGRLAPGATLESARAELRTVYGSMIKQHSEAYSPKANFQVDARLLRDQITSPARTVLLVLLGASILMFVIACSNVANLILARTVRREGELCTRAALGATTGALRRTLLAESLVLCGAGAALGVVSAGPMLAVLARYASRFSVRALDLTVDASMLWVGATLALVAAVALAMVPRLPSADASRGFGPTSGGVRITGSANRRLRMFAVTQIAASFVLLAGAAMLIKTLISLQSARTGFDTRRVLTVSVPVMSYGKTPEQVLSFYKETIRQITSLPSVDGVALGTFMPWRDGGKFGPGFSFTAEGRVPAPGEEDPRGRFRTVSPGYFSSLGVPIIAGRDFNEADRKGGERVVIVSQSLAQRLFPNQDAVNHHLMWTDPVMKFVDISTEPRRIVGVTADVDDENVVAGPAMTVYHPFSQEQLWAGNLFIHTSGNPYSLITPITRIIREKSAEQPVERAATLEDIRAEVLSPDRLNTLVFGGFAAVALAIAVVGVGGVLAFSVSGRTREFGIRLAIGSQPRHLVMGVINQGALIAGVGIAAGAAGGYALASLAGSFVQGMKMPGALPVAGSAAVLLVAALVASLAPAARAARVDIVQALRSE